MSVPFDSNNNTFNQPLVRSLRPILCAAVSAGGPGAGATVRPRRSQMPKRSSVTSVACQPCQQRKHKCDGVRPVCTPCLVKERPDCCYDAAGDQRRTSSLKQRIKDLETRTNDLQGIITSIGSSDDKDAATALAHHLSHARFRNIAEVAHSLRGDEGIQAASSLATGFDQSSVTGTTASPSSMTTGDSIECSDPPETPVASWMTDMAPVDGSNDDPNETSVSFWLLDASSELMLVDPMQSDCIESEEALIEMDRHGSDDQTADELPEPFW